MEYDFWYSQKQKEIGDKLMSNGRFYVTINGMEYTECMAHSKNLKSNWDDAVFLGTFNDKDICVTEFTCGSDDTK